MMGDIFEKDEGRLDLADDAGDMWPQVTRILASEPSACDRERLARVACAKKIHRAAPWSAVEGGNVVPDNSLIQDRVFHPRHESGCGVGFPLDIAHSTISGEGKVQSEVEPASARAEGEAEQARVCGSGSAAEGR